MSQVLYTKRTYGTEQILWLVNKITLPILLIGWLYVRGVSMENSISLSIVISIQLLTGLYTWKLLNRESTGLTPESLGMGLAIGSALATVSDQVFLITPLKSIAWVIPSVVVATLAMRFERFNLNSTSRVQDFRWIFIMAAAVILGIGKFQNGYGFALLTLAFGYHFSRSKRPRPQVSIFFATSLIALLILRFFQPLPEYGSFRLRPLYTGTDDLVFSESLSNSLSHFGLSDYSAAVGSPVRYHWFSLAWTGLTTRVSGSAQFDVTLHVVPLIAFLGIACLLWAIVFRLTSSTFASNIAVLVLFATDSLPDHIRFFFVSNTSNTLSHIWMLAAIVIFLRAVETHQKRWLLVFPILIAITFLAKTPYGAVLLVATLSALAFSYASNQKYRSYTAILILLSLLSTGTTYLLFLKPNNWEQRSFSISFNPFSFTDTTFQTMLITILFVISIYLMRFPISSLIYQMPQQPFVGTFYVFLSTGAMAGLVRFTLDGGSAEQYFLNSALIFGAILTGISIFHLTTKFSKANQRHLILLFCSTVILSALLFHFILDDSHVSQFPTGVNIQTLFAPAIALVIAAFFVFAFKSQFASRRLLVHISIIVSVIGVSAGIYSLRAMEHDSYNFTETVASTTDLSSLDWVRSNVNELDILATNRFLCNQANACEYDDSSFLISAVSGRRVLIEGPRFVVGGRPYPDWVTDRIKLSVAFANAPTDALFDELQRFNVRWFYLDTNFITSGIDPSIRPWNQWATIAFHSSNIYVLKLKQ